MAEAVFEKLLYRAISSERGIEGKGISQTLPPANLSLQRGYAYTTTPQTGPTKIPNALPGKFQSHIREYRLPGCPKRNVFCLLSGRD
jgi:hypothetical protein